MQRDHRAVPYTDGVTLAIVSNGGDAGRCRERIGAGERVPDAKDGPRSGSRRVRARARGVRVYDPAALPGGPRGVAGLAALGHAHRDGLTFLDGFGACELQVAEQAVDFAG